MNPRDTLLAISSRLFDTARHHKDTMSNSRRIREQEVVAQLEKEVYGAPDASTPPAPPADAPSPAAPPAPDTTPPSPEPPAAVPPAVTDATWEQRFKVLQGKYNAEVPKLHAEVKALTEKVNTLRAAAQVAQPAQLVKPEEIDKYGPDFIDMVRRAAEESFGPERDALKATIAQLEAKLSGVAGHQEQAAQQAFFDALSAAAPDWEAVDQDDSWKQWLAQYDADARNTRQAILDDAIKARDASFVASMIAKWKAQRQARTPSLAALAEPASSRATPPSEPTKKIWSKAEVDAFYREAAKPRNGKYTPEQIVRIEQDIESAVREGRYRT